MINLLSKPMDKVFEEIGIKKLRNILSCFDGISAGQVALGKAGIKYENYYASEIDRNPILVTNHNYPNTIQLGDINNWKNWNIDWSQIDLLLGGFCCQSFSIAGNRLNFNDERGKLFFVFKEILEYIKSVNPNIKFLAENVLMNNDIANYISKEFDVDYEEINSADFSAQTRKRLYWFNWNYKQLNFKSNLVLEDILEANGNFDWYEENFDFYSEDSVVCGRLDLNGHDFLKRVNSKKQKCQTLTAVCGGNQHKKVYVDGKVRKLTPIEYERLMGFDDNFTSIIGKGARYKALGNSWEINTVSNILASLPIDTKPNLD